MLSLLLTLDIFRHPFIVFHGWIWTVKGLLGFYIWDNKDIRRSSIAINSSDKFGKKQLKGAKITLIDVLQSVW